MERGTLITTIAILFFVLAGIIAVGQSLFENPDYKKAKELQKLAEKAYEKGDYDRAYEYSEESQEYIEKADAYAATLLIRYKANTLLTKASGVLDSVKQAGKDKESPKDYELAAADYDKAKRAFEKEEFESSISYSEKVMDRLYDIRPGSVLPKYYKVRFIPRKRDCFWRIAEYKFVYNDPWKWKLLYDANKAKLKNPNNPHLIFPGQVFIIPSINGEYREGVYDPKKYD
jgi:nucleoid-associated protein YgaU